MLLGKSPAEAKKKVYGHHFSTEKKLPVSIPKKTENTFFPLKLNCPPHYLPHILPKTNFDTKKKNDTVAVGI